MWATSVKRIEDVVDGRLELFVNANQRQLRSRGTVRSTLQICIQANRRLRTDREQG